MSPCSGSCDDCCKTRASGALLFRPKTANGRVTIANIRQICRGSGTTTARGERLRRGSATNAARTLLVRFRGRLQQKLKQVMLAP